MTSHRIPRLVGLAILVIGTMGHSAQAGYVFTTYTGTDLGTISGTGTNFNGISNTGTVVGFTTPDNLNFTNFTANPLVSQTPTNLNLNSTAAMAFGINSAGTVVGTDGNGNAFALSGGTLTSFLPTGATSALAFGINDQGAIVGQYTNAGGFTPGFITSLPNVEGAGSNYVTVNAPTGTAIGNFVNVQGINDNGLVVGFYIGNDDHDHGFLAHTSSISNGMLTATAITDPTIPPVTGELGATFVFSQILAVNDHGIAVGYYQDSTGSQHGFLYNTNTGTYTLLDDPSATFTNGVEITQITGINNSGEITGFYSGPNGVFEGFVGVQSVPEPGSIALLGIGLATLLGMGCVRHLPVKDAGRGGRVATGSCMSRSS
jgi:PEP-CTERM motif